MGDRGHQESAAVEDASRHQRLRGYDVFKGRDTRRWREWNNVYLANGTEGTVTRIPANGDGPRRSPRKVRTLAIAADATGVYWAEKEGVNIMKVSPNSDVLESIAPIGRAIAIAIDEKNVTEHEQRES